jgi:hypothetical protein
MRESSSSPSAVVASAYRAANRGRYAAANRFLSVRHRDSRLASAVGMRKSNRALAGALSRIKNRAQRLKLQQLCETLRQFEDPHFLWKGSTQGGRIKSIDVLRQTIREASATVTIALRLSDGRTRIERNRLRRSGAGWVIDIIEVLENNEMHPTRSAPTRNRGPRG